MNKQVLNQLVNALSAATISGKKKRRKRKSAGQNSQMRAVVPVAGAMMPNSGSKRRRRKKQKVGVGSSSDGSLRLKRSCKLLDVTVTKGKSGAGFSTQLNVRNLPWVKKIAAAYDRVHFNGVSVEYRSAVGTTTNGMVAYGFDWSNNSKQPANRDAVQGYAPFMDHAVWASPGTMVLEPSRLNAMQWYQMDVDTLAAPGYVNCYVNASATDGDLLVGELYVHIDVTFTGCVP